MLPTASPFRTKIQLITVEMALMCLNAVPLPAIRQSVSVATPPFWSMAPPCPAELLLNVQPVNVALLPNELKTAPPDPAEFPTRVQVSSVVVLPVSV